MLRARRVQASGPGPPASWAPGMPLEGGVSAPPLGLGALTASAIIATAAFAVYTRTLLPGVDLGDTAGFQAAILRPGTSAREAYPFYHALAGPLVAWISPDNPARGLNLFSALCAGVAAGFLTWVVAAVTRSIAAGVAGGALLAFGYTFWSQAVIAEVYSLHLALLGACLAALCAYARQPTIGRLAVFFGVYALAFGNHLSMILWFVPFAAFVLLAHPSPRHLLQPRVVLLAVAIAAAGALQYTPNVLASLTAVDGPESWTARLGAAWVDITKADWRETMVVGIHPSAFVGRARMWLWDAWQQVGVPGLVAAAVGAVWLWRVSVPWAVLVWSAYVINTAFAITYNVGDPHVFFLPSHYAMAFCAGAGVAMFVRESTTPRARERFRAWGPAAGAAVALAMIAYAVWRGIDTWPAATRHDDRRAVQLVSRLTAGLDEQSALLVSALEWDQENALYYAGLHMLPRLAWVRFADVRAHFPDLVEDNHRIGRDLVLTARAALAVADTYDTRFPLVQDPVPPVPRLSDVARSIPRGTPYVLTVLTPLDAYPFDPRELADAVGQLTGGRGELVRAEYLVMAGLAHQTPLVMRHADRPFRMQTSILGDPFTIRMDSWLPTETFRRGGFGHVIRGRERVLYVERGVSLVWFAADGSPQVAYAGNPYAPEPRFRIPFARTGFAQAVLADAPKWGRDYFSERFRPAEK